MSHIDCHCDTPHYEEDEHFDGCTCYECHEYRHSNFDHADVCAWCEDDMQAEMDAANETVYADEEFNS